MMIQWLGVQREEDGVFDEVLFKHGWAGLVQLRSPGLLARGGGGVGVGGDEEDPMGGMGGEARVASAAVEAVEGFYLRRMFASGRFGRRSLASAIREAVRFLCFLASVVFRVFFVVELFRFSLFLFLFLSRFSCFFLVFFCCRFSPLVFSRSLFCSFLEIRVYG